MTRPRSLSPRRLLLPGLLAFGALCATATADPVPQLVAMIRQVAVSPQPSTALLQGLTELGDMRVGRAQVQAALQQAGLPPAGEAARIVNAIDALERRGTQVGMRFNQPLTLSMNESGATIQLDRRVSFDLQRRANGDVHLGRSRGVKVGETPNDLYDLKEVLFTTENGWPVAKVTAGVLFITRTVTVPLPTAPLAPAPAPEPPVTADADPAPPTSNASAGQTYTVQPGDTLWRIANTHGLSVDELRAANPQLAGDALEVGQVLAIPGDAPAAAAAPAAPAAGSTYTVRSGDTLYRIATRHGVSVDELRAANPGLSGDAISVGQELRIPEGPGITSVINAVGD